MRIVGGEHKGKKLFTPKSNNTRPTSDRVRESLFNRLSHGIDEFEMEGARVLDLFAGTGALGLEALSRGAAFTVFIEEAIEARGLIRRNIEHLDLMGKTKLFRRDATNLGPLKRYESFNLIFLDPPYNKSLGEKALNSAITGGWVSNNALIIWEEDKKADITWPEESESFDKRNFGDTVIHFGKKTKP